MKNEFFSKIDWSELRNQKAVLLDVIDGYNKKIGSENDDEHSALSGILHLIDGLQDHAVDVLGVNSNDVYDFELEEEREKETPEEKFARENAETIFDMHVSGTSLYEHETMPESFVKSIVEDKKHQEIIKANMRKEIYDAVRLFPNNFDRDIDGNLTYDPMMYDYGFGVEEYCLVIWNSTHTKEIYLCEHCGSDNVDEKRWVGLNTNEITTDCEEDQCYCNDCEQHSDICREEIVLNKKLIGFQVRDVDNDDIVHPSLKENGVFNLTQMNHLLNTEEMSWKLVAVWSGDIVDPIMAFEGNPRG